MAIFIRHEPCPECRRRNADRSGNNLGVWTDHKYCFSCGYYERLDSIEMVREVLDSTDVELPNKSKYDLPSDCTYSLPLVAETWLKKYGLTNQEIFNNKIQWSEYTKLLIFPIYILGDLVMWQGRYFGDNKDHPKYITRGSIKGKGVYYILGTGSSNSLVLVEDLVSAIKVSRYLPCMPLFTNTTNKQQALNLRFFYEKILVWLDPDMREKTLRLHSMLSLFFPTVSIIWSTHDPKEHSDAEIMVYLKENE